MNLNLPKSSLISLIPSGSCVIKTTKRRNSHQIPKSPVLSSEVPKEPTQPAPAPSPTPRSCFWTPRQPSVNPSPSRIHSPVSRPVAAKKCESSKDSDPGAQTLATTPAKKFQTSKDMVIERYGMTFFETPESQGNTNPSIPTTNLTNLTKRKREEPTPRRRISIGEALEKAKSKITIVNEKSMKVATPATPVQAATPVRIATPAMVVTPVQCATSVRVTTPVQVANLVTPTKIATSAAPARKFPSKPTPLNTSPPANGPRDIYPNRPAIYEESVSSKRIGRKGPAIKHAGRIFIPSSSSSDGSDKDDNEDQVRVLEERLRDQKGYTRKQVEKSVELERKLAQSEKERRHIQEKLEAAANPTAIQRFNPQPSIQSRQAKKPNRLAQLNRNDEPELNGRPFEFIPRDRFKRELSMKELYKDYKFTVNDPWGYPTSPELPAPDPNTFRTQSWQKTPYKFWDQAKLMNIHIHRELACDRGPINIMAQPFFDGQSSHHSPTENSRSVSLIDDIDDDFHWPRGGHRATFDSFMGIPENMVPAVKGANLGFRAGILVSLDIFVSVASNGY